MAISVRAAAPIERVRVDAFTVPTDFPEADGTISWDRTSLVLVHLSAGGTTGLGYSYTDPSAGRIVETVLADAIHGEDALSIGARWLAMSRVVRNLGRPGLVATAISAVDNALWDLKARILDVSLADLVGRARDSVPIYGSGGFTSYSIDRLQKQLGDWAAAGIGMVKMKVGTDPGADVERVTAAREAIGPDVQLFVDANGAYSRKQALAFADRYSELGVAWFEEPVSSDDLEGLRLIRDRAPAGMEIAAGEYGYTPDYFERMLAAGAVDCLQADATRCLGITGWLAGQRPLRSPIDAPFRPLCAFHPRPSSRLRHPTQAHRVLPRPRTDRAHALRWRTRAQRRRPLAGPNEARKWARIEGGRRRALAHLGPVSVQAQTRIHPPSSGAFTRAARFRRSDRASGFWSHSIMLIEPSTSRTARRTLR